MIQLSFDPSLGADQQFTFTNDLSEKTTLHLVWNVRSLCWQADVTYQSQTSLTASTVYNLKIVPNWPLLRSFKGSFAFRGDLILLPLAASAYTQDFDFADLGESWFLNWMTPAEVASWEAANGI